jgi:hypothetical protein
MYVKIQVEETKQTHCVHVCQILSLIEQKSTD